MMGPGSVRRYVPLGCGSRVHVCIHLRHSSTRTVSLPAPFSCSPHTGPPSLPLALNKEQETSLTLYESIRLPRTVPSSVPNPPSGPTGLYRRPGEGCVVVPVSGRALPLVDLQPQDLVRLDEDLEHLEKDNGGL